MVTPNSVMPINVVGTIASKIVHVREESWKGRDGALRKRNRSQSATGANGFPFVELLHASAAVKKGFVAVGLGFGFRCGCCR